VGAVQAEAEGGKEEAAALQRQLRAEAATKMELQEAVRQVWRWWLVAGAGRVRQVRW